MRFFGTKKQVRNRPGAFQEDADNLVHDAKDEASFPSISPDLEVGDDDVPDNEVEAAIARAWFAKRREDLIEQQIQQHQAMWRAGMEESAVGSSATLRRVSYNNSTRGLSSAMSIVSDKTPVASNRQELPSTSKVPPTAATARITARTPQEARQTLPIPNATPPIDECSLITLDSEVDEDNKLCEGSWFDHKTMRGKLFYALFLLLIAGVIAMVVILIIGRNGTSGEASASVITIEGDTDSPFIVPTRTPTASPIESTRPPLGVIETTWPPSQVIELTRLPTPSPTGEVRVEVATRSPEEIDLGEGITPSPDTPTKLPTNKPIEPPSGPPTSVTLVWQHTVFGSGTNASKFGSSTALSSDGKVLAVGAPDETVPSSTNTTRAGRVYVYERDGDTREWRRRTTIDGRMEDDRTGTAVALNFDGSVLALSDPLHNNKTGSVRAFEYNPLSGNYDIPRGQELSGDPNSIFGSVLEISRAGTTLVVSSPVGEVGKVIVYQFKNDTNLWEQLGEPMLGATNNDSFGTAVALYEERGILTVAVSAMRDEETRGFVQAYQFSVGIDPGWRLLGNMTSRELFASLDVSPETVSFGFSLSLIRAKNKRFRLAVGAPLTTDPSTTTATGMVVVYELTGFNNWSLVGEPLFSSTDGDRSGHSVKLYDEGNLLLVGAPGSRNGAGSVNFYRFQSDGYIQQQRSLFNMTSPAVGDSFGWSVDATIDDRNTTVLSVSAQQVAAGRPGYVAILEELG